MIISLNLPRLKINAHLTALHLIYKENNYNNQEVYAPGTIGAVFNRLSPIIKKSEAGLLFIYL